MGAGDTPQCVWCGSTPGAPFAARSVKEKVLPRPSTVSTKCGPGDESTFIAERTKEPEASIPKPPSYQDKWRRR